MSVRKKGSLSRSVGITHFCVGLISGHRLLALVCRCDIFFYAFAQRFFTFRNMAIFVGVSCFLLPCCCICRALAAGRPACTFHFTAIQISEQAYYDGFARSRRGASSGKSAFSWRPNISGWVEALASWFWRFFITVGSNQHHDACQSGKILQWFDRFDGQYGIFGTIFMLLFLGSGTALAWRILVHLRTYGCDDSFLQDV